MCNIIYFIVSSGSITSVISVQLPILVTIDDGDDPISLTFEVNDVSRAQ